MLASLELYVTPLEPWPRVPFLGRALHAIVLGLLSTADPALANSIHSAQAPPPFSVCGPLLPGDQRLAPKLIPATTYCIRISALTGPIAKALAQALDTDRRPQELALDEAVVRLDKVQVTAATSYEALHDHYFPAGPARRAFELAFSPPPPSIAPARTCRCPCQSWCSVRYWSGGTPTPLSR